MTYQARDITTFDGLVAELRDRLRDANVGATHASSKLDRAHHDGQRFLAGLLLGRIESQQTARREQALDDLHAEHGAVDFDCPSCRREENARLDAAYAAAHPS